MNQKGFAPLILTVAGILILGVLISGSYYLGNNNAKKTVQYLQPEIAISNTPEQTSDTFIPTSIPDTIPQEDVLYLGVYDGIESIFFTNKEKQKYFDSSAIEKSSPYMGSLKQANGLGITPFDYKKLTNQKRISLNLTSSIQAINGFKFNDNKTILYISLNLEERTHSEYPDNLVNEIYQVDLNNLSNKFIWSNKIGSNKYASKGAAYVNQIIEDKFVSISLGDCYACGMGSIPSKNTNIIVNIATKNEEVLDGVGDVQFNLKDNTFSYKKLTAFQETCEPSPGCNNGQKTVMKPSGRDYFEKLP